MSLRKQCGKSPILLLFLMVKFSAPQARTALRGVSVRLRGLSSRDRLGDPVFRFILTHTAIEGISRQAHSPHKVTPCDTLGLPFPIELTKPRPVDLNRLSACVLALCFGDFNALTLSLFQLLSFKLREYSKHGQHEFARRSIGVDVLLVTDECILPNQNLSREDGI